MWKQHDSVCDEVLPQCLTHSSWPASWKQPKSLQIKHTDGTQLQKGFYVAPRPLNKGRARHGGAMLPVSCHWAGDTGGDSLTTELSRGGKRSRMGTLWVVWWEQVVLCPGPDPPIPHGVGRLREATCVQTDPQTAADNVWICELQCSGQLQPPITNNAYKLTHSKQTSR